MVYTDEYDIDSRLEEWGYDHRTVCHATGEYARDDDGDGFCETHVNTLEGFWSLLRSWLRPHRGISQEKLPLYLGFFEFIHNVRARAKSVLGALLGLLVAPPRNPAWASCVLGHGSGTEHAKAKPMSKDQLVDEVRTVLARFLK